MRRLFVLRPEPGAGTTVARARAMGLDPVAAPLFSVEAVPWQVPDTSGTDALLVTSANAIRHAGAHLAELRGLPVHAVGAASAEAARDAGFDIASEGEAGVDRLLASIGGGVKLLHLCGAERHEPAQPRQDITPLVVYRAVALDRPAVEGLAGQVAMLHSARAARRLGELVADRSAIALIAISAAVAEAAGAGWESCSTAATPDDSALLALAARLCDKARQA